MRRLHPSRRRPGTVLVWFALMVWVFFALAALTIDLGLVRATQREMLSLTDEAAMEAAWSSDQSATGRQTAAQNAITAAVNDTQTNDSQRFGAGPLIDFTGGIPMGNGYSAAQTLSINNPRVYQPTLAVNASNAVGGDIVQGYYTPPTSQTPLTLENNDYTRNDFSTTQQAAATPATLVRLRRSNEQFAAGDASSSNAPPLPYLFGRGSLLSLQNKGQGVTVRATSIAAAQPVRSAGWAQSATLPGVARLVLDLNSWNNWRNANLTATTINVAIDASGNITGTDPTNPVTGWYTVAPSVPPPTAPMMIGDSVPAINPKTDLGTGEKYVPLTGSVTGRGTGVVGFLSITSVQANSDQITFDIVLDVQTAQKNTTITLIKPFTSWTPASLSSLFTLNGQNTLGLQAPALVR